MAIVYTTSSDGVDWARLKAALAEDRFDNGRTAAQGSSASSAAGSKTKAADDRHYARGYPGRARPYRRRDLRVALRRIDPAVAAHGRAYLLQAGLSAAHRQLQGARRKKRARPPL